MITQGSTTHTEPDLWVINKACQGDSNAYDELVTCYRARAVRVARSFVRDRDLAEDIAQEAFVKTFLAIRGLRSPEAFFSFLMRTIVRLCVDHSRKSSSNEIPTEFQDPPATQDNSSDEAMYIQSVLGQLSLKLRTVIILRDIEGMEYQSIARTLRLPVGTVRSRLAAARASFKSLYLAGDAAEREA